MPSTVALHLETLTCNAESEHGSEPYLWPIMIAEEGGVTTLHVPADEFAATVLANEMVAGQSLPIPSGMDSLLSRVFNDPLNSLVVILIALFEKDSSPRKGSVAVLRHMESVSLAFVQDRLAEFRQSSGQRDDLRNALGQRFDLGGAETGALSIVERITTRLSSGGFDDTIDFTLHAFSGAALSSRNLTFTLNRGSDRFTLTGRVQVSPFFPPRCQAERDAVAQALAVVNGLQHQREILQDQLHHATPQQKSGIIVLIKRISEVDLPPAEAALAAAQAALAACEGRFGDTHAPLDHPVILG